MDVTRVDEDTKCLHVVRIGSGIFMKSALGEAAFDGT